MKLFRHPGVVSVLTALFGFTLTLAMHGLGMFEPAEIWLYDLDIRDRTPVQIDDPRLVIVTQTEQQIRDFDFPIPDASFADLLERIVAQKPRAIGIDIYRDRPVPRSGVGTERLKHVVLSHPEIIWGFKLGDILPPQYLLDRPDHIGFVDNPLDDKNQTVRRGALYLGDGVHDPFPSMELQVSLLFLASLGIQPEPDPVNASLLRLGPTTFRIFQAHRGPYGRVDDAGYQFMLDYAGPRHFSEYTITNILAGKAPPDFAKGKIVLVGSIAESTNDWLRTPIDQREAGVVIHAQTINQILRAAVRGDLAIHFLNNFWNAVWIAFLASIGSLVAYRLRQPLMLISSVIVISAWLWGMCETAFYQTWWLPFVPGWFAFLLSGSITTIYIAFLENSDRQALMSLFQRNVSSKVAEAMWRKRDQFEGGQRLTPHLITATVMFTDIRGFTSVSEKMKPPELLEWLNHYMDKVAGEVDRFDGVVTKYAGDSIMALFGFPFPSDTTEGITRDAVHAVRCALAMEKALEGINQEHEAAGKPRIGMRVGIYTGELVAGCMGPTNRLEYATIGDTVNTASRLESFDKEKGMDPPTDCRILIGEPTLKLIGPDFQTILVDKFKLKGKQQETNIYRVLYEKKGASSP